MHSKIFEIQDVNFDVDAWATEETIADGNGEIDGADYWIALNEAERNIVIYKFFEKWFPDNSFRILHNEPCKTAEVQFVGNIEKLYEQWLAQIQSAVNELTVENMPALGIHKVRMACDEPFELSSKFYMEEWCGCTADACDFFDYLRYLSKQNNGRAFSIYVGQVFDYHF